MATSSVQYKQSLITVIVYIFPGWRSVVLIVWQMALFVRWPAHVHTFRHMNVVLYFQVCFFATRSRDICNEVGATAVPYVQLPISTATLTPTICQPHLFYCSTDRHQSPPFMLNGNVAWMCDKLTFPGFYDLVVIVDHQMHHARHGRYRGWMSETGTRVLHISDGGENRGTVCFCLFRFFKSRYKTSI